MPAAKIEKPVAASGELANGKGKNAPITPTNGNNVNNTAPIGLSQDPQKIANTIIDKKIRNLEKRKVRLLELKALEDKGQQLEADQKVAVKKLDGVVEMIDMLKEIGKNVTDGLNDYAKQLKKQQKREQFEKQTERQQQDAERVKLWLNAQFILSRLGLAKADLLQGENGAVKLEETQVEALEKLVELLSPQSFDLIEASVEKVNYLLEGNKREFITGVSYSVLKETIVKLIESKYFENIATVSDIPVVSSGDKVETVPVVEEPEPVSVIESAQASVSSQEKQEQGPAKPQPVQQNNNVHHLNQLCFMRDPVVENELQHKDPAVVAVASSGGFSYQPQMGQALPVSSVSNIATSSTISSHYSPHMYPAASMGSIPTQTFTNPSYQFIPVTIPAPISHQMPIPEQVMPVRNIGPGGSHIHPNEKSADQPTSEKQRQFPIESSPKEASSTLPTSQDAEGKPVTNGPVANGGEHSNGHFKRNNRGGGPRGNPRGNFTGGNNTNNVNGGGYRSRGGKAPNSGFFNGGNNYASNNQNFNSSRPMNNTNNRQNGGGNRSGPYRQDRGVPRNNPNNNFNSNQAAPVSAK